jgi:hypothetical protein
MNTARYSPSETVTVVRNCKVLVGLVALAFAVVATIGVTSEPLSAQTQANSDSAQNQAGLEGILQAIVAGGKVSPRASLPLQVGFFSGQPALYITPEVGVDPNAPSAVVTAAKQLAITFNANFIPQNFGTLPGSPAVDDIFSFTNFTQGNVLASAPHPAGPSNTDVTYSPLWQLNLVSWNSGRQKRVLTSQAAIEGAAAAGDVTIAKTPIIVECSVIFTPGGGLLPGAKVTGGGSDTK